VTAGTVPDANPHYHQHRDRLRRRFMHDLGESMEDYELLELVLTQLIPRRDVKPLAKELVARFGGFAAVIAAPPEALTKVKGLSERSVIGLKVIQSAALRLSRQEVLNCDVINSWDRLIAYCNAVLARETVEQVRLLLLDRKNKLIADEVQHRGTVDQTALYPREVVKRALDRGASAIILVHNHPSGDPTPSQADIATTREVYEATSRLGITLHDHVIIGRSDYFSFRAMGLLET